MNAIADYIESGILELYVLGHTSAEESREVEHMAAAHGEIRRELDTIRGAMEAYATAHAVQPGALLKPVLLATIDYFERLKQGEEGAVPPLLTAHSRQEAYASWLNRADMAAPDEFDGVYVKLIGVTAQATTAIVWIRDMAADEVHHKEYEHFLIVEGTCQILAGDEVHHLGPGDYFAVPLHTSHRVVVTSPYPCKAILQRIAA
jgi:mannose-6-phosphate isomerase-like protein (cupin superfamily)